jgi:hypothetical protein
VSASAWAIRSLDTGPPHGKALDRDGCGVFLTPRFPDRELRLHLIPSRSFGGSASLGRLFLRLVDPALRRRDRFRGFRERALDFRETIDPDEAISRRAAEGRSRRSHPIAEACRTG